MTREKVYKHYTVVLISRLSDMTMTIEHVMAHSSQSARKTAPNYTAVPSVWAVTNVTKEKPE